MRCQRCHRKTFIIYVHEKRLCEFCHMNIKDFKRSDFDCRCCGKNNINMDFLEKLQLARTYAGIPFVVISGCRCDTHNKDEGGKPTSDHLTGEGADIRVINSMERFAILDSAIAAGFRRIGIGRGFIHLGNAKHNPQAVAWIY